MLENLHIQNVALIEEGEISFESGLNILTGETGAGKSMIIDSLNFVLGERAGRDFLRKGAKKASVEALFMVEDPAFYQLLEQKGIPVDEEEKTILITRTMQENGKSACRLNGSIVTTAMLREISQFLLDFHGQHQHQSLLREEKHIELLDQFCMKELEPYRQALGQVYQQYKELEKQYRKLSGDEKDRSYRLDLLRFQIDEIQDAQVKEGEEEALLEQKKRLSAKEKIRRLAFDAAKRLNGGEEGTCAFDQLSKALTRLEELSGFDPSLSVTSETLSTAVTLVEDVSRELDRYLYDLDSEEGSLEKIEDRLTVIYQLKRKYGATVKEILDYLKKAQEEYELLAHAEEHLNVLQGQRKACQEKIAKYCTGMTHIRRQKAEEIEARIQEQLKDLEMKHASFHIAVERKKEFTPNGWDKVQFFISTNLGEEKKPLAKIASGGEMSRIMLAMKTVIGEADQIETFIFDEIDTGISGRAAQKVAEKMALISRQRQIICITHLPQIASMADAHFLIEKHTENQRTLTTVTPLAEEERAGEIARLMSGVQNAEKSLEAAKELLNMAKKYKNEMKNVSS